MSFKKGPVTPKHLKLRLKKQHYLTSLVSISFAACWFF